MSGPRILLSEGSSTNAREAITALGLAGYRMDVCDPNPACLARFSRFVRRVHRCPPSGEDPVGYLRTVRRVLTEQHYDVLLPVNEQAYLFAWARDLLEPLTGLAVAPFASFTRVQTKAAFTLLLDELDLPHPPTLVAHDLAGVIRAADELGYPCWVKTSDGTASTGVRAVGDEAAARRLVDVPWIVEGVRQPDGLLVQAQATGWFEQAHAVFDGGELVAVRTDRRLVEGSNGGPALKLGVDRPAVTRDLERIGRALAWHGGFSVDYFWDDDAGRPSYVDPNPRLTEPMNSLLNGVNLADLQVRMSLGEHPRRAAAGTRSARSHALLHAVLGAAARGGGRRGVLTVAAAAVARTGEYAGSREALTPLRVDPLSAIAAGYVVGRLSISPGQVHRMTASTITSYSLGHAITMLSGTTPEEAGLHDERHAGDTAGRGAQRPAG